MQLNDELEIYRPPEEVEAALYDPKVLAEILPSCKSVDCVEPGHFRARIERKLGLLNLRVEPDITLRKRPDSLILSIRADNPVAGSVVADVVLTLRPAPKGTKLAYQGTVETSGLAARLLADRQAQFARRVKGMFLDLQCLLEAD